MKSKLDIALVVLLSLSVVTNVALFVQRLSCPAVPEAAEVVSVSSEVVVDDVDAGVAEDADVLVDADVAVEPAVTPN